MSTNFRLFFALELEAQLKNQAQSLQHTLLNFYQNTPDPIRLRLVSPGHFHLTLRFLGQVKGSLQAELISLLKQLPHHPIPLRPTHIIGLPTTGKIHTLAWGFEQNTQINKVYEDLNGSLTALGFEVPKRAFLPHVTFVRSKKALTTLPTLPVSIQPSHATHISLISSELTPDGPIYQNLHRVSLPSSCF